MVAQVPRRIYDLFPLLYSRAGDSVLFVVYFHLRLVVGAGACMVVLIDVQEQYQG